MRKACARPFYHAYRVLDSDSSIQAEISTPLSVDLALQIECLLLVGNVTRCDNQSEAEPKKERVESQKGPVVQQNACKAHYGSQ